MNYPKIYESFYSAGKIAALQKLADPRPRSRADRINMMFPSLNQATRDQMINNTALTDDDLGRMEQAQAQQAAPQDKPTALQRGLSGMRQRASDAYKGIKGIGENVLDSINDVTGQNANDYYNDTLQQYGDTDSSGKIIYPTSSMTSKDKIEYANSLRNRKVNQGMQPRAKQPSLGSKFVSGVSNAYSKARNALTSEPQPDFRARRARIESMYPQLDPAIRDQMINNPRLTDSDIDKMEQAIPKQTTALQRGLASAKRKAVGAYEGAGEMATGAANMVSNTASDLYQGLKGVGEGVVDSINDATGQNANDYYRDMVTQYGRKDSNGNPIFPTGNMTSKAKIDYANDLRNKNVNAKARTDYLMQERNKPSRVPGNFEFPMRDATPAPAGLQLIDNPMSKQYNELVRQGENIRRNTYSPVIDGLNSQISSGNFGAAPAQRPVRQSPTQTPVRQSPVQTPAQQSPARPQGRGLMDRLLLRHPNSPIPTIPTFGSGPTSQATPPRQKSTLADMQRLSARLTNRDPNANNLPVNQALRGVFGGGGQATPTALNMRQVASPNGYQRRG